MTDELIERLARKWLGFTPAKDRQRRHVLPGLETWASEEGTDAESLLHSISRAGARSPIGQRFVSLVTIGETYFYRHGEQLQALVNELATHDGSVEVWCAACSSGPEAWTLAMMLDAAGVDAKIWATDIDKDALAEAKAANTYSDRMVSQLPLAMRDKYLKRSSKGWSVVPALRARVDFGIFNLVESTPTASRFDAVICRNVLIYFEPAPAEQAVRTLLKSCKMSGRVWLGVTDRLNVPRSITADPRLNTTSGAMPRGGKPGPTLRASAPTVPASDPKGLDEECLRAIDAAIKSGNEVVAAETVESWCERAPRAVDAQLAAAALALNRHDYVVARLHLATARRFSSTHPEVCYLFGVAAYKEQDYPAAQRELSLAAHLDREKWYAALLLSMTDQRLGNPSAERRSLEMAIRCLSEPNTAKPPLSTMWVASAHDSASDALHYATDRLQTLNATHAA